MKTLLKFNKRINMLLVSIILVMFYFTAFGFAKMMYRLLHKPKKYNDSYWDNHIAENQKINYDSPY